MVEKGPQPIASFPEIIRGSQRAAREIDTKVNKREQQIHDLWDSFSATLDFSPETQMWSAPYEAYRTMHLGIQDIAETVRASSIHRLHHLVDSRSQIQPDWKLLANFLMHDYEHLAPAFMFNFFNNVPEKQFLDKGQVQLFDRHKKLLEQYVTHWQDIARMQQYPLAMIEVIAKRANGEEFSHTPVDLKRLMTNIAYCIQGHFIMNDYAIIDTVQDLLPDRNHIFLDVPEDLMFSANEAFLFSIIYNLAKNAAKSHAKLHYEQEDQMLYDLYAELKPLKQPCMIHLQAKKVNGAYTLSVFDDGAGISLDASLQSFQTELAKRLKKRSIDDIRQSDWFQQIESIVGPSEAMHLLQWPQDPFEVRNISVSTLFDLLFVAGFSGDAWNLRSVTSGMGLWGVQYATQTLAGETRATNTFKGGALFSLSFPEQVSVSA